MPAKEKVLIEQLHHLSNKYEPGSAPGKNKIIKNKFRTLKESVVPV